MIGDFDQLADDVLDKLNARLSMCDKYRLRRQWINVMRYINQIKQNGTSDKIEDRISDIAILIDQLLYANGMYALEFAALLHSGNTDQIIAGSMNWLQFFGLPIPPKKVLACKPTKVSGCDIQIRVPVITPWYMVRL